MADHTQASGWLAADAVPVPERIDAHGQEPGFSVGAQSVTYFDMFGVDDQCVTGTAPSVWTVTGAPDDVGASAPPFPCGGPWALIWVGRTYTVTG